MTDIALTIIVAAAAATGNALSIMAFYVINDANIYQRLRSELIEAFPEEKPDMSWSALEKLPYLVDTCGGTHGRSLSIFRKILTRFRRLPLSKRACVSPTESLEDCLALFQNLAPSSMATSFPPV